jgi:hypothetical protein
MSSNSTNIKPASNYVDKFRKPSSMPASNNESKTAEQIIQMIDENTNFTEEEKEYLKKKFETTNVYKRGDFLTFYNRRHILNLNYLQRLIDEKEKGQGKTGGYKKRHGKTLRKKKNRRKTKRIRWR